MSLILGSIFPNFAVQTTKGDFVIHDYIKDSWALIFSHPLDFSPVCSTEIARIAQLQQEFDKRGVKLIGLSLDSVESHKRWIEDIKVIGKVTKVDFPMIAGDRKLAVDLGMFNEAHLKTAEKPLTARAVFIVGPDLKLKASTLYNARTGRNFAEILRVIDSLQLSYNHNYIVTPADWKAGDKVLLNPMFTVTDTPYAENEVEHVKVPSGLDYLRYVSNPYSKD